MKMKKKRLLRLLLSLVMVLALMVGFAPGMGMTAWADTALPADGSDAGNGLRYYVGYAMVQQGGNYETGGDDKGGASLFDKNPNTKACIGFVGSYSVEFSYASAIIPHNYYFRTGDDTSTQTKRNPSAWKLEGKNTDNTWTVLDEKSGQTYTTANYTEVKFGISNNTAYQTFRLTITANNSSGRDDWPIGGKPSFQLTEFYMSGTIAPASSVTATYKVVNGTWSDGTTADKTETVASGSTLASVPTGMKASEGYKGGAWDTNPADATITEATTFTYTFEAKTAAVVTTAPQAKALTSNGSAQELVTPGQASGGEMYYALGTDTTTAPTDGWKTSTPTATEAGTYYVWYKVVGDADHLDVDPACVTVTIVEPSSSAELTLGDDTTNVAVTGLDALAEECKEAGKTVVVTMTVDKKDKTEVEAADSAAIETAAEGMRLEYIDISLTKTVNGTESPLTDTSTVLEIIVPYDFSKKMQTTVKVYRYHGTSATALTEATTKADGTYRLDREKNLVYIYANQFSTYAIGFTPTYTVSGTLDFGSFTGTVSFSLTGNGVTKTASSTVTNGSGSYSFTGVPAGTYDVTASWSKGGKAHTLMFAVTVPAGTP